MNQRIHELMQECGIPVQERRIDGNGYGYMVPNYAVEKLAVLIVRECALQCQHNDDMDRIEKHFGVEE